MAKGNGIGIGAVTIAILAIWFLVSKKVKATPVGSPSLPTPGPVELPFAFEVGQYVHVSGNIQMDGTITERQRNAGRNLYVVIASDYLSALAEESQITLISIPEPIPPELPFFVGQHVLVSSASPSTPTWTGIIVRIDKTGPEVIYYVQDDDTSPVTGNGVKGRLEKYLTAS